MKQLLLKYPLRVGVASAILAGGVLGGAVAFADTPSTSPSATPGAAAPAPAGQPAKKQRHPHVVGKVTNVISTGGLSNQGTITVAEPDGHSTTFSVTGSTKAWKYQGQGQKLTKEAPTSIATSEVIGAGLVNQQGGVAARRILDTGFKSA